MASSAKKPIIGILGGVASGKSTVALEFKKHGCKVIDADKTAHELLLKPAVIKKLIALFGSEILNAQEQIDRSKLADIVFADAEKLSVLNKIIHPAVLERSVELIEKYKHQNKARAIVLDMPLLAEVGWDKKCDSIVFIECSEQLRAQRAKKKGIFSVRELKIRENFQISLDNKRKLADNIIDNNSGLSMVVDQVAGIFDSIIERR